MPHEQVRQLLLVHTVCARGKNLLNLVAPVEAQRDTHRVVPRLHLQVRIERGNKDGRIFGLWQVAGSGREVQARALVVLLGHVGLQLRDRVDFKQQVDSLGLAVVRHVVRHNHLYNGWQQSDS